MPRLLGSMANELSDQDEQARTLLADLFKTWKGLIAAGLERMQVKGALNLTPTPGSWPSA